MKKEMKIEKKNTDHSYIHDEIVDRIGDLRVNCPECENIDDDQYACTTCWGGGRINVLEWINEQIKPLTSE